MTIVTENEKIKHLLISSRFSWDNIAAFRAASWLLSPSFRFRLLFSGCAPEQMQNRNYATIIDPEGPAREIELSNGDDKLLRQLRDLVGGYLEVIALPGYHMLVNEDGKANSHKVNDTATLIAHKFEAISKADYIAGTAVIIKQGIL